MNAQKRLVLALSALAALSASASRADVYRCTYVVKEGYPSDYTHPAKSFSFAIAPCAADKPSCEVEVKSLEGFEQIDLPAGFGYTYLNGSVRTPDFKSGRPGDSDKYLADISVGVTLRSKTDKVTGEKYGEIGFGGHMRSSDNFSALSQFELGRKSFKALMNYIDARRVDSDGNSGTITVECTLAN